MNQSTAKILIVVGALLIIAGLIFYFFGDKLRWLGRLPGDIRIEKENSSFYFPITTCILISLVATLIFKIIQWFK
jgi:hypothetical protein